MSKIQNAIHKMEKERRKSSVDKEDAPIGRMVKGTERVEEIEEKDDCKFGDVTSEFLQLRQDSVDRYLDVDLSQLRRAGFLAPDDENRVLTEEYRRIKRPLLAHAFGRRATKIEGGHAILVTSPLSGDGKTFTAINLALSIATEQDSRVLLVDADLAKRHISKLFGVEDEPGLTDLLEKKSPLTIDEVIFPTNLSNFGIMGSGRPRSNSTELLSSERMESLIKAISARDPNQIILIDSSPLLATSEALVLTGLVGQVVIVVRAEHTPQHSVIDALESIDDTKVVNFILNQARKRTEGYGYYN